MTLIGKYNLTAALQYTKICQRIQHCQLYWISNDNRIPTWDVRQNLIVFGKLSMAEIGDSFQTSIRNYMTFIDMSEN